VAESVLWEVTDREIGRLRDPTAVGLLESGHHLEKGRLPGTVGSAQSDPVAGLDLPVHGVEQDALAEGLVERGELEHAQSLVECRVDRGAVRRPGRVSYSPRALAATDSTLGTLNGFVR